MKRDLEEGLKRQDETLKLQAQQIERLTERLALQEIEQPERTGGFPQQNHRQHPANFHQGLSHLSVRV